MRPTFHLTPAEAWAARDSAAPIEAPSLATEGFVHCTDGAAAMVATANRHYRQVPGSFVVLTIDLDATASPWRFDDPSGIYPHVYGSIASSAVLAVQAIPRAGDGTFLDFAGSGVPEGIRVETIYVVEATYGPNAAELRPFSRPEHLGHLGDLIRSGQVLEAGGYLDFTSAILLVRADNEAAALELFRDDVYIRTGVWTDLRARAWGRVIAEPAEPS
jgi:uncharacterized protein (DUF952 family)/uncharacterized protein YciI